MKTTEIQPFRGVRYDPSVVGDLSQVVAPPYDVIGSEEQGTLYRQHPHNIVRLILNDDEPDDRRYACAAEHMREWLRRGILKWDPRPLFYVCEQEFHIDGEQLTRRALTAAVRLREYGEGKIHPHESTMSGPREDRLRLMRACEANLSQIFMLLPDEAGAVSSLIDAVTQLPADAAATHASCGANRMWCVRDAQWHEAVKEAVADQPLFIADGHHRYETALRYRQEERDRGVEDPSLDFVMAACVPMSDPGLRILPTHRLVRNTSGFNVESYLTRLGPEFEVQQRHEDPRRDPGCVESALAADRKTLAFGLYAGGASWWRIALKDIRTVDRAMPKERSSHWRRLSVAVLHHMLLAPHFGDAEDVPEGEEPVRYVHDASDVVRTASSHSEWWAFFVKPTHMADLRAVASSGEKMPPKSTYFYPKMLTGLVLRQCFSISA